MDDVLLGRRTSKIKKLSKLTISRITILKRQHEVRASHARSDMVDLLNLGHQDRALARAELVIKEQNILDAFLIIEAYCHVLVQKIGLIKKHKQFPSELREAFATLSYASSRCGEFPELLELRRIITNKYGNELSVYAVEMPSIRGVNPKVIQKLSRRQPDLLSRIMALEEIASEIGISLHLVNINEDESREVGREYVQPELRLVNGSMECKDKLIAAQEAFECEASAEAEGAAVTLSSADLDVVDHLDDLGGSP